MKTRKEVDPESEKSIWIIEYFDKHSRRWHVCYSIIPFFYKPDATRRLKELRSGFRNPHLLKYRIALYVRAE